MEKRKIKVNIKINQILPFFPLLFIIIIFIIMPNINSNYIINRLVIYNTEEILKLALKEATYNGVSNFRYIDRIIHEWKKKGIKTKDDVIKNNEEFRKNKSDKKQELFDYDWLNG